MNFLTNESKAEIVTICNSFVTEMKQSGNNTNMGQDDEMLTYVWFKDVNNLREVHSRYQQMLIAKALSDLFGHKSSVFQERDDSSRVVSFSTSASGSAPSSARSLNSSASVAYTSTDNLSVTAPSIPSVPSSIAHDVSFLQEFNHLFSPGCRICQVSQ